MNTNKLPNYDFTDANVGDPVYHIDGRQGIIKRTENNQNYPIIVDFGDAIISFTKTGQQFQDEIFPKIFHEPIKFVPASAQIQEERVMMVWDKNIENSQQRVVIYEGHGIFVTWFSGTGMKNIDPSRGTYSWTNALPVEEWHAVMINKENITRIKELEAEITQKQHELNFLKGCKKYEE